MELSKVLYNDTCGDWSWSDEFFSDEFLNTYKKRYGKELNMNNDLYRYDPNVIALFEELGNKKSSHEYARLKICNFPTRWLDCMEVKIFESSEHIIFSKEKAYKSLLHEIITSKVVSEENIAKYNKMETDYKKWGF